MLWAVDDHWVNVTWLAGNFFNCKKHLLTTLPDLQTTYRASLFQIILICAQRQNVALCIVAFELGQVANHEKGIIQQSMILFKQHQTVKGKMSVNKIKFPPPMMLDIGHAWFTIKILLIKKFRKNKLPIIAKCIGPLIIGAVFSLVAWMGETLAGWIGREFTNVEEWGEGEDNMNKINCRDRGENASDLLIPHVGWHHQQRILQLLVRLPLDRIQ